MLSEQLIARIRMTGKFFTTGTACFDEADSNFAPEGDLFPVAAHVAHSAHTIDWFIAGMFSPSGFALDFEAQVARDKQCTSLEEARGRFDRAVENAVETLASKSDEELMAPLADNPIFGQIPRAAVIDGLVDHTAHHRGALAVYARLAGKVPAMPYE
jgi:uncharacterized damage-inducible protein DinB